MNQGFCPSPELFYEKKISSFPALSRALRVLDEDSGVRLLGTLAGKKCMVFITRFGEKYTIMTYSTKKGTGAPGERLETIETDSVRVLEEAIRRISPHSVRAFVY